MQAEQISDTKWQVTDVAGSAHTVFVAAGAGAADAIAALDEAKNPPAPTTEQLAAERAVKVKTECKARIYAVASAEAQMNIIGAQAAGQFDATQEAAYLASVQWIADMRAACDALIADPNADHTDDSNWPTCPAEVVALAKAY